MEGALAGSGAVSMHSASMLACEQRRAAHSHPGWTQALAGGTITGPELGCSHIGKHRHMQHPVLLVDAYPAQEECTPMGKPVPCICSCRCEGLLAPTLPSWAMSAFTESKSTTSVTVSLPSFHENTGPNSLQASEGSRTDPQCRRQMWVLACVQVKPRNQQHAG